MTWHLHFHPFDAAESLIEHVGWIFSKAALVDEKVGVGCYKKCPKDGQSSVASTGCCVCCIEDVETT